MTLGLLLLLSFFQARSTCADHLRSGALETTLSASLTSVESNTSGEVTLGIASFQTLRDILWVAEFSLGYHHQSSLDGLDVDLGLGVLKPLASGFHPYVSFSGGRRFEWIGSFRRNVYSLGPNFGFRQLIGSRAGIRTEYRYRRIKGTNLADYTEQSLQVGLALFWNNES